MTMGDGAAPLRNDWATGAAHAPPYGTGTTSSIAIARTEVGTPVTSKSEQIRLALRVVVHLARTGPLEPGVIAPQGSTQQGIATSLQVTQGAVSKVLRRLVAADVVRHERHHVNGEDRRMQAYSLTARGSTLARQYRERFLEPDSLG